MSATPVSDQALKILRHIDASWHGSLLDAIEAGHADGSLRPTIEASALAELLMAMIDGALPAISGGAARMDGERMCDQIVRGASVLLGCEDVTPA